MSSDYLIGIDVGGTFTDVVGISAEGKTTLAKASSTPGDQSEGVLNGLARLAEALEMTLADLLSRTTRIVHGTTVATNALLERNGAKVAMLTTDGHRDILEMREGLKPERYNVRLPVIKPLVPRSARFAVHERMRENGAVETPLDASSLQAAIAAIKEMKAEAVAVCFLHSWRDTRHEVEAAAAVRAAVPNVFVTCSGEVLPQIKEYERFSTTAVNAYVGPMVSSYLDKLNKRLTTAGFSGPLFVILSHGGIAPVAEAARVAAGTALSGPAGGVAAAVAIAQQCAEADIVTFDMGGTSTDIALVEHGKAILGRGRTVGDERIALETLDIETLGAGGGSIAHIASSGMLQVGPRSAGAVPGPVAYGAGGTEPTVTDANLVLGYLDPDRFLGGRHKLDITAAKQAFARLGSALGLDPLHAAAGVVRLANTRIADGIRVATVRRGIDPRGAALLSFGGAAGLHATAVAREIGMSRVIVPLFAAGLSAWGMLHTDLRYEVSRSVLDEATVKDENKLRATFALLEDEARAQMQQWWPGSVAVRRRADMRYGEQIFEIDVPLDDVDWDAPGLSARVSAAFGARHKALFTYELPGEEVVLVNARVAVVGELPAARQSSGADGKELSPFAERQVIFEKSQVKVPVFDFMRLPAGQVVQGPAMVENDTTTILLRSGDRARMRKEGVLDITISDDQS